MMRAINLLVLAFLTSLCGCSTSQVALDHADNGVSLVTGLQTELRNYESRQAAIDDIRKRVVLSDKSVTRVQADKNAINDELYSLSGKSQELSAHRQLRNLADMRAKQVADAKAREKADEEALDKLMQPLPPIQEKLSASRKAMAGLAQELSFSDRLKVVTSFIGEVKAEVEKNKKAADDATKSKPD